MSGTLIDSLVISLGLDSKGFADGIENSTKSLAGFATRIAGMFVAFKGVEGIVDYFKDLHTQLAEIGFASRNLGVAGTELSRLGEVAQLFGGQMSDAQNSVQGLQAAVFNLRFRGQLSDQLLMLQRFGIAYLDAQGHARDVVDIARDASKVIDQQALVNGLNEGERQQLALALLPQGGGLASAAAQGSAGFDAALAAAAKDQKPLTDRTIQSQVHLDQSITRLQASVDAQASVTLGTLTPAIELAVQKLNQLANDVIPYLNKKLQELIDFLKNPPPWFKSLETSVGNLVTVLGPAGTLIVSFAALTTALSAGGALVSGLTALVTPLTILAGYAGFKFGEWINDKTGIGDSLGGEAFDITHSPPKLQKLLESVLVGGIAGVAGFLGQEEGNNLAQRLLAQPSAPPTPTAPRNFLQPDGYTPSDLDGSKPTAMNSRENGTSIVFENVTVNSRGSDARSLANDFVEQTRRKINVANADGGYG